MTDSDHAAEMAHAEWASDGRVEALQTELATLRARVEALQVKADRYDWLKAHRFDFIARNNSAEVHLFLPVGAVALNDQSFDQLVDCQRGDFDAARRGGEGGGT